MVTFIYFISLFLFLINTVHLTVLLLIKAGICKYHRLSLLIDLTRRKLKAILKIPLFSLCVCINCNRYFKPCCCMNTGATVCIS